MTETHVCEFCHRPLLPREECDCPGSKTAREEKKAAEEFRRGAELRILVEKEAGQEEYHCQIDSNSLTAAFYGISVLIRDLAEKVYMPLDRAVAVLATVLLAPDNKIGGN